MSGWGWAAASTHLVPLRTKIPIPDTHFGAQITCHHASYLWVSFHTLSFLTRTDK